MKCPQCRTEMKAGRENYRYALSGLPNVTLSDVEVRRCPKCGEDAVVIPNIEELQRALACAVATKRGRLAPEEIRYLRAHLGWSGADLSRHLGVTAGTVSRWENGREAMGPVAERLLRLLAVVHADPSAREPSWLVDVAQDESIVSRFEMHLSPAGWRAAEAEAA